ncbi:cGMP-dependent protein kinase [Aureococcus anophagefferens]|nr:cGMP-dependent protein kinase [Aureococcus anophagefferens]
MAGEPRPKTVVGGEGAFLRRADADSHLVGDDDDINTFGSGESGESHFIEHTFESPAMQRVAAAVRRRPSFDGTARYTSDRVYPGWILDHRHFEEAKHLVKENRLRDALQNSPKERTDEDVEVLTMFLMAVWPTTLRLGEARVNEIARCANLRRFHQGQYIVTEGEVGLTFYIIVSGAADVEKHGEYLATLKMGRSFGEASLGAGAPPRNASCIASSATTELLELRKTDYDKIMKSYQDASSAARAVAVVKTIEIRTFNRWPSGKDGGHETVARCAHKLVPLVELGPGSCFGERGILYGELRKATVTAATDVTLLALDKVEFESLLQRTHAQAGKGSSAPHSEHRHHLTDDEIAAALALTQHDDDTSTNAETTSTAVAEPYLDHKADLDRRLALFRAESERAAGAAEAARLRRLRRRPRPARPRSSRGWSSRGLHDAEAPAVVARRCLRTRAMSSHAPVARPALPALAEFALTRPSGGSAELLGRPVTAPARGPAAAGRSCDMRFREFPRKPPP